MAEHTSNPGYEATDADVSPLFKFLAFLAVFIVFAVLAVILLFKVLSYYQPLLDDEVSPLAETRLINPDVPRLQVDPPEQKIAWQAYEAEQLSSYGWVQQDAQIVRIPIERAIDLVAKGTLKIDIAAGGSAQ